MLKRIDQSERGHVLLDALVSIALVTISIATAFSGFQTTITLLSVQGPSHVLLCKKIQCENPTLLEGDRIIHCTCQSQESLHTWEVIR